jgi:hypothetical protein
MGDRELRESILRKSYDFGRWKMLNEYVFRDTKWYNEPQHVFDEADKVKKGSQLGIVKLDDGKSLAIFEVEVNDKVRITKNRVELRDIAAKHIDQHITHGALVIYYSKNQKDYRFSFIAKQTEFADDGQLVKTETHPKRFTYVLGENESCTTASKRLLELAAKKEQTPVEIKDVIDAFSVEKLNNEFFKKYKEHYFRFNSFISEEKSYRKGIFKIKNGETEEEISKNEKPIRDFTKKLLGRIVFLHFLQKKGWMGCPINTEEWKNGDKLFMQNLFANYKGKDYFHSKCLKELFFKTLNNPDRDRNLFSITNTRVPYLNGGLFDNDFEESNIIDFPPDYFKDLLDFFEQYNFTIDENSPEDHDVGIDPEMLGHIFENLLEENREKGTFYTPKEIVHYMCQESLIKYLTTHLAHDKDIESFITKQEVSDYLKQKEIAVKLNVKLKEVKICDPAIGSGAFPIGLLQEIFKARLHIYPYLRTSEPFNPATIKKEIIQQSIYGVDIEKGAVDIARLRFWLSLVVDEDVPEPLPNLDYKIMQGNSLLERYYGVNLQFEVKKFETTRQKKNVDLFGNVVDAQTSITEFLQTKRESKEFDIKELEDKYFYSNNASEKKAIRKKIRDFENEFITEQLDKKAEEIKSRIGLREHDLREYEKGYKETIKRKAKTRGEEAQRERLLKKINTIKKDIELLKAEHRKISEGKKKLDVMKPEEKLYFLWHLYFIDVFKNSGFDIVIGNPPYIQLQKMGIDADMLQESGFETFVRTGDIYCLFYELGNRVLKPNGVLTFITSNKWMRASYGSVLRNYFMHNCNPLKLIDFGGYQVFENATVDTNILISEKAHNLRQTQTCILGKNIKSLNYMSDYFRQNSQISSFTGENSWVVLSALEQGIKSKIERIGTPLKEWDISIYRGVLTGFNEAFIISQEVRDKLISESPKSAEIIRPILRGRDIHKFQAQWNGMYLIATHTGYTGPTGKRIPPVNIDAYPAVRKHLDGYWKEIEARLDQGDTPYHLRSCIYMDDFFRPKIIYPEITKFINFYFDENENYYANNKCFILTGERTEFLTAFLNSSLFKYCFLNNFPELLGGTRELRKVFLEKIPVIKITDEQNEIFSKKVKQVQELKKRNGETKALEKEIDNLIFDLYELTAIEKETIGFIEIL